MEQLSDVLFSPWALRAIIASSLVGITCGVLGVFIVLRNMSLLGDALSHSVLPGIVISFIFFGYNPLGFFMGAMAAGLVSTALITWIQQNAKTRNDAAIGIVFTVMFSLGIMGISWLNNKENVHLDLKDFLFGNVLAVTPSDLIMAAIVSVYSITTIIVFYRYFFATTFQPVVAQVMGISVQATHYLLMFMLSFTVVSAMRTVGVILVVAMLITPAATALLYYNQLKKVLFLSGLLGMTASVFGFVLAIFIDTNPGPMMVISAGLMYGLSVFFAPEKGLVRKWLDRKKQGNKVIREDILKWMLKNEFHQAGDFQKTAIHLGLPEGELKRHLHQLEKSGMVTYENGLPHLSVKGQESGQNIVRAHRLWETFQVSTMGLKEEQIHSEAERLEHTLTPDILDEVEEKLGFPKTDPHGSPIPPRRTIPAKPLISLHLKQKGKIAQDQLNHDIEGELWEMGLLPDTLFTLCKVEKDQVIIEVKKNKITIPAHLAQLINIY